MPSTDSETDRTTDGSTDRTGDGSSGRRGDRPLTVTPATDADTVRPMIRPAVAAVGALVLLALVSVVPGLDRLAGARPVAVDAALRAVGGAIAAAALLVIAPRAETFVVESLAGPIELVRDAGTVVRALVSFAAVVVAYAGLAPAFRPLFVDVEAAVFFDGTFALTGLGFVAIVGYLLYRNWAIATDLVTDWVVSGDDGDSAARDGSPQFDVDEG